MKRKLQRIWEDLQQGENVDLYVAVSTAVVVVLLDVLEIAPQSWLAPINLAVLAVLAAAMLGNRYRLEKIVQRMDRTTTQFFQRNFPENLEDDLRKCDDLWFVGITLSTRIHKHYSLIENKLKQGGRVRVLVVDPAGEGCRIAANRVYGEFNADQFQALVKTALNRICELKGIAPDRLIIKTLDHPMSIGGFAVDPDDKAKGILFLKHYSFKVPGELPCFVLRPQDGEWFEYFKNELINLWEGGEEWDCSSQDCVSI